VKIKSQKDFWSGLMFVGLGVTCAAGATAYGFGTTTEPGPGFLPFGLGLLLAVLGGAVLFKALVIETEDGDPIGRWAWRSVLACLLCLLWMAYALPRLGLLISLPPGVLLASLAVTGSGWRQGLIQAVVLTSLAALLRVAGLQLAIPLWPSGLAA
jgi:1,4-dihydroxy-2-naphthoate octaprenyltransferase